MSAGLLTTLKGRRMPGFLADFGYDGITRIDLGQGYWCDVKNCLTADEKRHVDDLLGAKQRIDVQGGAQFADMDFTAMQQEMVVSSLVAWNITDPDGSVWMLTPDRPPNGKPYPENALRRISVRRLPAPVFAQIYEVCNNLNAPRSGDEAVTFPDGPVGGDTDGDGGTGELPGDPEGEGTVAVVRPNQRGRRRPAPQGDSREAPDHNDDPARRAG